MQTKTVTYKREQIRKEIKKQYADKIVNLEEQVRVRDKYIKALVTEIASMRSRPRCEYELYEAQRDLIDALKGVSDEYLPEIWDRVIHDVFISGLYAKKN